MLTWPDEGHSNGQVVLDRGDIMLPMKDYVTDPITLTVERGYVTRIQGGLQAEVLRDYMASYEDPEAYAVSHIGWGLQPRAHWSMLGHYGKETHIGMDARAFEGNFLWSMGPNNEAGGQRTTACHIDIPMRHCTVTLDDRAVVIDGARRPPQGADMTTTVPAGDISAYARQGFGTPLPLKAPFGLLIIDFVNGFADPGVFGGGNIPQAIERTRTLLAHAREQGWPVAHSRIVFSDDDADSNIFCLKVPGMLTLKEDSHNSAIVPQLAPAPGEYVVRKSTPSAFYGTMLAPWLAQRGVQTLVVAGCVTSGCVRASVVDAMQAGFRPLVVSDCCGDRALGPHEANLFDMAQKYAAVMPLDQALADIGALAA